MEAPLCCPGLGFVPFALSLGCTYDSSESEAFLRLRADRRQGQKRFGDFLEGLQRRDAMGVTKLLDLVVVRAELTSSTTLDVERSFEGRSGRWGVSDL